jgi:hypothetical protein
MLIKTRADENVRSGEWCCEGSTGWCREKRGRWGLSGSLWIAVAEMYCSRRPHRACHGHGHTAHATCSSGPNQPFLVVGIRGAFSGAMRWAQPPPPPLPATEPRAQPPPTPRFIVHSTASQLWHRAPAPASPPLPAAPHRPALRTPTTPQHFSIRDAIFRGDAFLFFVLTEPRSQALQVMLARSASLLIRRGASSTRALSTFYTESHEWLKVV